MEVKAGELKGEPISDPGDVFEGIRGDLTRDAMEALWMTLDLCDWNGTSSVTAAPDNTNTLRVNKQAGPYAIGNGSAIWLLFQQLLYCQNSH